MVGYLVDETNKVIFGFNDKCGSSHIKKMFYYLTGDKDLNNIHRGTNSIIPPKLLDNLNNYTVIMIIRNPYERLVSGFLNKFRKNGEAFNALGNDIIPTFDNLITYIKDNRYIDNVVRYRRDNKYISNRWFLNHFYPQTYHDPLDIISYENLIIYDISNIDYNFIEELYKQKIPDDIKNFRGGHETYNKDKIDKDVSKLILSEYEGYRPYTRCFYNDDIKSKVDIIFKNDFDFFRKKGFEYNIT
jgi:hypothetical protein